LQRIVCLILLLCAFSWSVAAKDQTVIHVINVKWKADAAPAAVQTAITKAQQLPKAYRGILKVWTVKIKNQLSEFDQQIVMQFRNAAALKSYTDSPAQKAWYEVYLPVRDHSRTCDVSK
jgi:hypothetical protein